MAENDAGKVARHMDPKGTQPNPPHDFSTISRSLRPGALIEGVRCTSCGKTKLRMV